MQKCFTVKMDFNTLQEAVKLTMIMLKTMIWTTRTVNIVKRFSVAFSSQDKSKRCLFLPNSNAYTYINIKIKPNKRIFSNFNTVPNVINTVNHLLTPRL